MITNLNQIKQLSESKTVENQRFANFLLEQNQQEVDFIVHQLFKEYSEKVDCKECGNCCAKLEPRVADSDIERIITKLKITKEEFIKHYTSPDDDGFLYFNDPPCVFLKNNKCEIYNQRPDVCRSFPHLGKDNFIGNLHKVTSDYSVCPIVYNMFEDLKEILEYELAEVE